jgi:hypothetical protein
MNFQSKLIEKTAEIRERALAIAKLASQEARTRATQAADRLDGLKRPLATLQLAGRELNKVARRHVSKFVSENSAIARAAGKDVSQLAQTAFAELRKPATTVRKRKVSMTRKRVSKKAA